MTRFVVMTGPGHRGSRALIVRDRFSWAALLFAPLWLARHGLFLWALLVLLLQSGALVLGQRFEAGGAGFAVAFLITLAVALEGPRLRIAKARRKDLEETAFIEAASPGEAELIHFTSDPDTSLDEADLDSAPVQKPQPSSGWRSGRSLLLSSGSR